MTAIHITDRSDAFSPAEIGHPNPSAASDAYTTFGFEAQHMGQNLQALFEASGPSQSYVKAVSIAPVIRVQIAGTGEGPSGLIFSLESAPYATTFSKDRRQRQTQDSNLKGR